MKDGKRTQGERNLEASIFLPVAVSSHCSWLKVKVVQTCLFETPWTIQSMEISRPEYWSGQPFPSLEDLPNPGIDARSPVLQVDSLPAKPQGKPMNTGVGSLSLLQWIFLTNESNWGLMHCRWTVYKLSYQGSTYKGAPRFTLNQIQPGFTLNQVRNLKERIFS